MYFQSLENPMVHTSNFASCPSHFIGLLALFFCLLVYLFGLFHNERRQSLLLLPLNSAVPLHALHIERLRPVSSFDCVIKLNKPWRQAAADLRDLDAVAEDNCQILQCPATAA